jgi:hypothetical protein
MAEWTSWAYSGWYSPSGKAQIEAHFTTGSNRATVPLTHVPCRGHASPTTELLWLIENGMKRFILFLHLLSSLASTLELLVLAPSTKKLLVPLPLDPAVISSPTIGTGSSSRMAAKTDAAENAKGEWLPCITPKCELLGLEQEGFLPHHA